MANDVYLRFGKGRVMEGFLIFVGGTLAIGAVVTIIAITIQDMRLAKISNIMHRHPHSQQFRRRPLVSIIMDDEPTNEAIQSIRHGNYRKLEILYTGEQAHGDLMLPMNADTVLERTALSNAINQFNMNPNTEAVEIVPRPELPDNLNQLLHFYRRIASAPFIAVRAAFHVVPIWGSGWPVLLNMHRAVPVWRARIYAFCRWLMYVANACALIFVIYAAAIMHRPEFLLLYLGLFTLWLVTAIWLYPYFSLRQRLVALLLAPVSFGYFLLIGLIAPVATALLHPKNDAFARLWRSSHQH
jgi:hypothetical protein